MHLPELPGRGAPPGRLRVQREAEEHDVQIQRCLHASLASVSSMSLTTCSAVTRLVLAAAKLSMYRTFAAPA
eukprot:3407512-Pyramimonas_sp.AAC.1